MADFDEPFGSVDEGGEPVAGGDSGATTFGDTPIHVVSVAATEEPDEVAGGPYLFDCISQQAEMREDNLASVFMLTPAEGLSALF